MDEDFFPRSKGHGFESQTSSSAMLLDKMMKALFVDPAKMRWDQENSDGLPISDPLWVVVRLIPGVLVRRYVGFSQFTSKVPPWLKILVSVLVAGRSIILPYVASQRLTPYLPNWLRKSWWTSQLLGDARFGAEILQKYAATRIPLISGSEVLVVMETSAPLSPYCNWSRPDDVLPRSGPARLSSSSSGASDRLDRGTNTDLFPGAV